MTHPARPSRKPLNLLQLDDNSCLSCVAANVLYVLGLTDHPDPRRVDREIGREPNCPTQRVRVRRFLLQQGLRLHLVCAYEPERFLREGLAYLRGYYRHEWDAGWDRYWTAQQVERHRFECRAVRELASFGAALRTEHRQPTLVDLHAALGFGRLVWLSVDNASAGVDCHAVLVQRRHLGGFSVYSPENSGNCLRWYRPSRMGRVWLRTEGMTAVWAPSTDPA